MRKSGVLVVLNKKKRLISIGKWLLFALCVAALSSFTTYLLVVRPPLRSLVVFPSNPSLLANQNQNEYVESGSPYDNRTVDGSTASAKVIFHGPRNEKKVALTFDAEMTDFMKAQVLSGRVKSSYDKRIIDTLNATHTPATLFLTGMWIELYPDVTRELAKNPLLELGSHSYTDSSYSGYCYGLHQLPNTVKIEEIGATEKLLREFGGIDNRLFRFPGGCYAPDDVDLVMQANDVVVHWDVKASDGFNSNADQIIRTVVDNTQNGSIIVLHMNGEPTAPKTADALPGIISQLRAKGFEFVKVTALLHMAPIPSGAQGI